MQRWQVRLLGRNSIPRELALFELEQFFNFLPEELQAIRTRRGTLNRLGCALQVGFRRMTGRHLNSVRVLSQPLLAHLGQQLAIAVPDIASLRALYRRERTLYEHQVFAADLLRFRSLNAHAERGLVAHLRKEAITVSSPQALLSDAYRWLYEHRYLIPSRRRVQERIRQSIRYSERQLLQAIDPEVPAATRKAWMHALLSTPPEKTAGTAWDWLRATPGRKSKKQLSDGLEKLRFLQSLGVDRIRLEGLSTARQRLYAQQMAGRKASQLNRQREPQRSLELVCFARFTLLQTTDTVLALIEQKIVDLWRLARQGAQTQAMHDLRAYRNLVEQLWTAAADADADGSDQDLREEVIALLKPFRVSRLHSRAGAIRLQMTAHKGKLRTLLAAIIDLPFAMAADHPLMAALTTLRALYGSQGVELPADVKSPFAPCWSPLIADPDRKEARYAFEAATLLLLRRSLRNGSVWVDHSLMYRSRDELFIAPGQWERQRSQHYRRLGLPQRPSRFIDPLLDTLDASLHALAEAVQNGEVTIEEGKAHLSRPQRDASADSSKPVRTQLFAAVGEAQLPQVLLEVDSHTHFSWILLGRPPRNERELLTLYAALLAQGTDLTARQIIRMIPEVTEEGVQQAMRLLEADGLLRKASSEVLDFMQGHAIVKHWGKGTLASSDSMSLEATRHLWISRVDPRRRKHAIGMYSHVLDRWGIVYDQPIILNRRQAGAAIEGAVRQEHRSLAAVAVDTHGYTDFGMAIAKVVALDLCPRLAHLTDRKLYVPRGFAVPAVLKEISSQTISLQSVHANWDGIIRIAASIQTGWCSAVLALERYGSAARGDPVYQAGVALGQLIRTLYLCDYLSNPEFRSLILKLLNYGESIHTLQRAIYAGPMTSKRGRRSDELVAISGSLSLLANIVMAWNTQRMQQVVDQWKHQFPERTDPSVLAHIAPIHHGHINLRGIFQFPFGPYRAALLDPDGGAEIRRSAPHS
jgi:TnpA family transposase